MESFQQRRIFNQLDREKKLRRRRRIGEVILALLLILVVSGSIVGYRLVTKKSENKASNKMMTNLVTASPEVNPSESPAPSEEVKEEVSEEEKLERTKITEAITKNKKKISSKYACLLAEDGTVLYEKDADKQMYPASMTKLMTALLVVEKVKDFNKTATIAQETINYTLTQDASVAGFEVGEKAKLIDLLYGVMLPSGAECCITLGDYIAGSDEKFIDMMNARAKELGLTNTHFMNSSGLTEEDHYSTAKDMAKLMKECLKNDLLKEVMLAKSHKVGKTNVHKDGFTFYSSVYPKFSSLDMKGITYLGGKTGYTDEAGYCLASAVTINDKNYFFVTAGGTGNKTVSADDAYFVFQTILTQTK